MLLILKATEWQYRQEVLANLILHIQLDYLRS